MATTLQVAQHHDTTKVTDAVSYTHLLTVCLGNQWASEAEALCVVTQCTVNQLSTGSHVTPLVDVYKRQVS